MSGSIIGLYGLQRSGKSLLAYFISEMYHRQGVKVYTNQIAEGFITIEKLTDIPTNTDPKVLWLDEAYYFLDSRNFGDNKTSTLFFNSVGKMNILLLLTGIHPGEVDLRLRRQHKFIVFVKSDLKFIYYRIYNNQNLEYKDLTLRKEKSLFENVKYDTNYIPGYVDCNLNEFNERIKNRTKKLYPYKVMN